MINAIFNFDCKDEAVEKSLAVEYNKEVCNIIDSFEFPISAHCLNSFKLPVLTMEEKLALGSAFANYFFASKIFLFWFFFEQKPQQLCALMMVSAKSCKLIIKTIIYLDK